MVQCVSLAEQEQSGVNLPSEARSEVTELESGALVDQSALSHDELSSRSFTRNQSCRVESESGITGGTIYGSMLSSLIISYVTFTFWQWTASGYHDLCLLLSSSLMSLSLSSLKPLSNSRLSLLSPSPTPIRGSPSPSLSLPPKPSSSNSSSPNRLSPLPALPLRCKLRTDGKGM